MRRLSVVFLSLLLTACSGGPSSGELEDALEGTMRAQIESQIQSMKAISGEKATKSAMKMMGLPNPEDIRVEDVDIEDTQETEKGDYLVKAKYTLWKGEQSNKMAARITLTEIDGGWKIVNVQRL